VKVSTLQDYGVDKFFFLENNNADTSQHNVVFIARGECTRHARTIAGQLPPYLHTFAGRRAYPIFFVQPGSKVDIEDRTVSLLVVSQ